MADEPFPSDAFGALVRRVPRYAKLAFALGRDPRIARARRAAVLAGAIYLVSPIDLVPGIIPILGQLDDLLVVLVALKVALDGLSPERRRAHLAAVGLGEEDLASDVRAVGASTAWVARRGARVGRRVVTTGARGAARSARWAGRSAGRAGRDLARRRPRRTRSDDEPDEPPAD
jgi:uncharacterized membrane protein YkvA (DUF1232 family)